MKRRDILILAAVVLLAAAAFLASRALNMGAEEDRVLIYLHNELYGSYPLEERTVRIEQENGSLNVLRITGEGVYMESANCKNQDCVHMGMRTADTVAHNESWITCLPHGVSVQLVLAAQ